MGEQRSNARAICISKSVGLMCGGGWCVVLWWVVAEKMKIGAAKWRVT
jgi:hypothetical protein